MTMPSAAARAYGFLLWSFPRRLALLPCRHLDWLGHAAAVTLRSPRRLRRSPEDAPLHPAGALVDRTSPTDWRITDPRGSVIVGRRRDQPPSGTTWRRAEGASSADGRRTARAALPGTPGALGRASRGPARDERGIARSSQGPCASSVRPNPGTPMLAYGWWYARKGTIWSSSGRTRPVPAAPSVGPARCVTGWSSRLRITDPRGTVSAGPVRSAPSGTTGDRSQSRSGRDSSQSHATTWASPSGPEGRVCWSKPSGWEQAARLRRGSTRRRQRGGRPLQQLRAHGLDREPQLVLARYRRRDGQAYRLDGQPRQLHLRPFRVRQRKFSMGVHGVPHIVQDGTGVLRDRSSG